MAVFRHEVMLSGCSRDWFQQFIVELHHEVEALRFDGGRLVAQLPDGQEGTEVVLVAGLHAREGAEYRIGPEADGLRLAITAWDRARETGVRLLGQEDGGIVTTSVKLRSASRPESIEILWELDNPQGAWLTRRAALQVKVSLTRWWAHLLAGKGAAPVVVDVTYPLLKVKLEMFPRPAGDTADGTFWAVNVVTTVRGQSWARPLAAVGLRLFHRMAQAGYGKQLDEIARTANPIITALATGSPRTAAKATVELLYTPKGRVPADWPGKELP